ncbi:hypothetical protein ILUMI_07270 [Ignelater luminosus]|uniref:Uncharacterized protein n=1 Tax=Ignelater luminosus TaxID=2038154 RepID=A0A8K0D7R3_IGNLU|nr:hypothetical protein ILUMI_07270 [Ignelater luminosus]
MKRREYRTRVKLNKNKSEREEEWKIGTCNIKSLQGKEKELKEEYEKTNPDILAITETKKMGKGQIKMKKDHRLIYTGVQENLRTAAVVGCIVHKILANEICKWKGWTERILATELGKNKYTKTIIVVYGQIVEESKEEVLIAGDFNRKVDSAVSVEHPFEADVLPGRSPREQHGLHRHQDDEARRGYAPPPGVYQQGWNGSGTGAAPQGRSGNPELMSCASSVYKDGSDLELDFEDDFTEVPASRKRSREVTPEEPLPASTANRFSPLLPVPVSGNARIVNRVSPPLRNNLLGRHLRVLHQTREPSTTSEVGVRKAAAARTLGPPGVPKDRVPGIHNQQRRQCGWHYVPHLPYLEDKLFGLRTDNKTSPELESCRAQEPGAKEDTKPPDGRPDPEHVRYPATEHHRTSLPESLIPDPPKSSTTPSNNQGIPASPTTRPGDRVLLRLPPHLKCCFAQKWFGPYRVQERLGQTDVYLIDAGDIIVLRNFKKGKQTLQSQQPSTVL